MQQQQGNCIRFIGDIHGHYSAYMRIIRGCKGSIQVGDMGVGFRRWPHGEPCANPPHDLMVKGGHRFIRGNHDNPGTCRRQSQYIPDGTVEGDMMFIGGAHSIDKAYRIEDFSWWPDEELSIKELGDLTDLYIERKPRIMVTHDCPEEVATAILSTILRNGPTKADFHSRTRQAFQAMFSAHSPDLWIFGHYHIPFDHILHGGREKGTRFICVPEDAYLDIDVSLPTNEA